VFLIILALYIHSTCIKRVKRREIRIMNQSEAIISVTGLKKSYKDIEVLKGIDFTLKRGSIFTLLGSNEECIYRQK